MTNWHLIFGLFLIDFFTNTPYVVELEKDLSIRQQLLDMVVLRKMPGLLQKRLPDGFDGLADHNLLTYKFLHEPLNDWAIKELVGHYVNYRKQVGPSMNDMMPESNFKLYAISTRFPKKLAQKLALHSVSQGVYDIVWGTDTIRLIVLSQIPTGEHNAISRLFSAKSESVIQARNQYEMNQPETSTIVQNLFEIYQQEKIDVSYTVQDYQIEYVSDHLNLLPVENVIKRYSTDERLMDLPAEEVFNHYSVEDRLNGLPAEDVLNHYSAEDVLNHYSAEDRLNGLTEDEIINTLSPDALNKLMQKIRQH